ncbi:DUF6286 domain-containing Asp23/Gls24 family envelope stress response protein [Streptomyces luteolus]|uniref:DUF6286 domain-containing protein n=1 Tax=Streptomyces luteolus TaxID=3043615 RepID=A0ABT6SU02_9ACTN|nr:DUF6286 domain-containing Asp23/Gls24 family envelope stress response protein [Streptomyces sp. B-S-A12]MDI3419051.1 DUF6286 domain-containing protein [Streptomyces sp. B-S-A12]
MTSPARRGSTVIADRAVRKIAERAAGEAVPDAMSASVSGSATVRGGRASVGLRIALPYPAPLSDTARRVRQHVAGRVRYLTGLETPPPRLTVSRLSTLSTLSTRRHPVAPHTDGADTRRPPRRWWSQRRLPMALVTVPAAAFIAAVTADVIRVHATRQAAAEWRVRTWEWLGGHGPGDTPVVVAGTAVTVLGAWLIVLALTPGRRRQLPLSAPADRWNVAVDRSTLAAVIRDSVRDVPGVGAVSVRVRRRSVRVRARLDFGDVESAREQITAVAGGELAACRPARTPRLKVTVTCDLPQQPEPLNPDDTSRPPRPRSAVSSPPPPAAHQQVECHTTRGER